jgi:acetylornithine deacetylase/succinyl-diaminopimelate desuccinylase-like protein
MSERLFSDDERALLLRLLRMPTGGPLEADAPPELWQAQRDYARSGEAIGMRVVHHAAAEPHTVLRDDVPIAVRLAAEDPGFLRQQPSLVLRLGPAHAAASTVMFNVHLDTVSGAQPVSFDGAVFRGRGAVDAKGPAAALLAGIRAAKAACPAIGRDVGVLVQAVSGEEGGAMGTYGTRPLVDAGFTGRLNVFCEPTGMRYLPRATAAMTACVLVRGEDAIDDRPGAGHNASVLLGFLAGSLADALDGCDPQGAVCVAGLHTGDLHNRVYGSGRLLLNLSYASSAAGARLAGLVADALDEGLRDFGKRFLGTREFHRTAADATAITSLRWLKRGLPSLRGEDPWADGLLAAAGVHRWPDDEPAFTCDAIWMDGVPGACTVVLGPGSLEHNNAHADGEYVPVADLEEFARAVRAILVAFADRHTAGTEHT